MDFSKNKALNADQKRNLIFIKVCLYFSEIFQKMILISEEKNKVIKEKH